MRKIFLLAFVLITYFGYSQGSTCPNATPFCAGADAFIFPNVTGVPSTQNVGCLGSIPNPTWFYLQIDNPGELVFNIFQSTSFDANGNPNGNNIDVDFIAWGPFNSPDEMCALIDLDDCDGCPSNTFDPGFYPAPTGNVIDCSYDGNFTETMTIHNAVAGQIYAVLITNFNGQAGFINLQQTNEANANAGSTNCEIVCPLVLTEPGILCPDGATSITATSGATNPVYTWYNAADGPDGTGSVIQNGGTQLIITAPGTYSVHASGQIGSGQTCNNTQNFTVTEWTPPGFTPPATVTACNVPGPASFNLDEAITSTGLDPTQYEIYFHTSEQDAMDVADPIIPSNAYTGGVAGDVIWMSIQSLGSGCMFISSFSLDYECDPAGNPPDLYLCDVANDGVENFDLTQQDTFVLDGLPAADYTISYHDNQADANTGNNPINPANAYPGNEGDIIYVHMHENADPANVALTDFTLHLYGVPDAILAAGPLSVCVGAAQPTVTFTGQNGVAPYTFTYTINNGTPQTAVSTGNSATININTATPGTFDIDLTNVADANCSQLQSESITVTVNPAPNASILAPVTQVCVGGAQPQITIIGTDGTAPYTFSYILDSVPYTQTSNAAGTYVVNIPTTAPGTFSFSLTDVADASCNQAQNDAVTITVNALPEATVSASVASVCQGGTDPTITLTGSGSTAPYTFDYTVGGVPFTDVSNAAGVFTFTIPTTAVGPQVVAITNVSTATCSQLQNDTVTVTVNPTPDATISAPVTQVCVGGAQPQITITGTGGTAPYTFTYILNTVPYTQTSDAAGVYIVSIPTTAPGTFDFALTDVAIGGCNQPQTDTVTITVDALPEATVAASVTSVCQGGTDPVITLTGSGSTAPYTFDYTVAGVPFTNVSDASGVFTFTIPTTVVGPQTVVITNVSTATCSQTQNDTVTVTINPGPQATILASTTTVCANGTQPQITITGTGGTAPYTFNYTIGTTPGTATSNAAGVATVSIDTTTPGTYVFALIDVADANCLTPQNDTVTITVNPIPDATISATPTTVCIGDAAPVITITGTGGTAPYTFSYDYNGGATATLVSDASGVATFTVPSTATAGSYIFNLTDVSDANCNSAQSDTVTITVNALPTATMAADVTAVCVGGTSPVITFTGAGGTAPYTFSYTLDGAPFTAQTAAGSSTVTVTAPTTVDGIFTYELTGVSDANCSQAQTATVSITVNPLPTATITLDNATVCQGGTQPTVTFTGAGGIAPYTFDYTLGGTPLQVISNAAGVATIQIPTTTAGTIAIVLTGVAESGATTCFQAQSGSVSVTVDPLPAATVSINDTAICQDGTPLPV
ncbi:MAG: hypothetical protein EOO50_15030, partial [Flavobacterium sp.]